MKTYIIMFTFIVGSVAHEDLSNKAFLFPKETANAHIILNPEAAKPLEKLTVCLRSYTELTREHSLFSLACPGSEKDNTFLILTLPPNVYSVYVNQEENRFKIDPEVLDWKHTCVSWNSDTGVIQLWVNGKLYPRKISNKGFTIPIPTFIILGQDQDSFGGGFQAAQSFVGEMRDVHMWDFVLSQEDIQNVLVNDINGNVLSWTALQYESNGEVVVPFKVQNLGSKVLLFPKESATAHVILTPETSKPLEKLSICLRSYTEVTRQYSLFSLASPGRDNAFLILQVPPNICSVSVNQEGHNFKTDTEVLDWRHTCVSWESDTGVLQLWVNGKLYPRKTIQKGFAIPSPTSIVLGQDQDSFGGGFEAAQSFVGEISDVHMWDYILTPEDINKVLLNDKTGNILNWTALQFENKGGVLVQPKLQCKTWGYTASMYSPCN